MKRFTNYFFLTFLLLFGCQSEPVQELPEATKAPFTWENATIYFLLTDRFNNGDPANDTNFGRTKEAATLRGFMGGDIKGITQKIREGYFTDLGVNAIWFTPVVEQNKGIVEEGTGPTYGYHGYWAQDWTALDPNFGTEADLREMVETAHNKGIRVLIDVVINHTGPVSEEDPVWPAEWVRTSPKCEFNSYATTVNCTLVKNLPDIKTESNAAVGLPKLLVQKWQKQGRLEKEAAELNAFFQRTGYPKAPRFYIMKWLVDFIKKYGVDGFRVDTAKHTEETVWDELKKEADYAFAEWKKANPEKVLDDSPFYMVGEVYNYNVATDTLFDIGDRKVNYFANGMTSLINFGLKYDAHHPYDSMFTAYSDKLHGPLQGKSIVSYISSHDDSEPFDKERQQPFVSANKLMLSPGGVQIYYGDETARPLIVEGANGDANLRSFMNWEELEQNAVRDGHKTKDVHAHWQKLGQFRNAHPAIGAGVHRKISDAPYYFSRVYESSGFSDKVVVGLDLAAGQKEVNVAGIFENGEELTEHYSGKKVKVENGKLSVDTEYDLVLFGK